MALSLEEVIENFVAPAVADGTMTLYLGAGFSLYADNLAGDGIPSSDELVRRLIRAMGQPVPTGTLPSLSRVFGAAQTRVPGFEDFLRRQFSVKNTAPWHRDVLTFRWRRIYTTNIDDLLEVALEQLQEEASAELDIDYFHYSDVKPATLKELICPVVYLHGSVRRLGDGVVFNEAEYGKLTARGSDWLNEAAIDLTGGPCCVVGSRLLEPDLQAAIQRRKVAHGEVSPSGMRSFVVLPDFDTFEEHFFNDLGFEPIRCTAETFFAALKRALPKFLTRAEYLKARYPHLRTYIEQSIAREQAWFGANFEHVPNAIGKQKNKPVIFSQFFQGWYPDWPFIAHDVPAKWSALKELHQHASEFVQPGKSARAKVLAVIGPAGSGKSTMVRQLLATLASAYPATYEFMGSDGVDVDKLWASIRPLQGPIVLSFEAAREHYYAINAVLDRALNQPGFKGRVLVIIEDRVHQFERHRHHFKALSPVVLELGRLSVVDANALHDALERRDALGKLALVDRPERIERIAGHAEWDGDLLVVLRELTSGKRFDELLAEDLKDILSDPVVKSVYLGVCLVGLTNLMMRTSHLQEFTHVRAADLNEIIRLELRGRLRYIEEQRLVGPRHARIAQFHYIEATSIEDRAEHLQTLLEVLSKSFDVSMIRHHPLEWRIYRELISHDRLGTLLLPGRPDLVTRVYTHLQNVYGRDAIFWLQFGKHYHDVGELDKAEHCLRKGRSLFLGTQRDESFQIIHSLGHLLMDRYILDSEHDERKYREGMELLNRQLVERGRFDAYAYVTLTSMLFKLIKAGLTNRPVELLDKMLREGIRLHPNERRLAEIRNDWLAYKLMAEKI